MRIGLDARTVYRSVRRGTGKNLIDLYRHLGGVRPGWRVVAYHRATGVVESLLPKQMVQAKQVEMVGDRVDAWGRWRLPMAAWGDGVDVLHCPANLCPEWMPIKTVVTIHDLIPLDRPQAYRGQEVKRFERSVGMACRRAAWIICPSRYTRDRLVSGFSADPERITVNPWAADSSVRAVPEEQWAGVLKRYGVTGPFLLHFGAADVRKNTRRVLEAWAMLDRDIKEACGLLVVGLDQSTRDKLSAVVARLGECDSVRLHGFADESDLPTLLSAAKGLVYPSLSEGFGLPMLDAWAARTVVMTSNCSSLPEVAGDAALLVDPADECSIAHGMSRLISDEQLCAKLTTSSCERLKQYTWEATAQRFAQAFEQAVGVTGSIKAAA